ncbi:ABC transporter permease [Cellvibrio sp. UBA7671]|jgi:lipopolysaccharide transport system permease protein|uniref:ABC transporter permease n=1 Tax=Cellvibrio sp. UBA7671 TaxID=1946312 RepID=UPI002F35BF86
MFTQAWKHKTLIWQLLRRDIQSRYRGSVLGLLWSLGTPMIMLAIYTFVFQYIFKSRWNDSAGDTTLSFAIVLFLGLSIHGLLAEILTKSPVLITGNPNFVKKIVFPLELLSWITLFGAIFTFLISFGLLLLFILIELRSIPLTALLLPIILLPYLLLLLGLSWILAALGVYLRDIQQITGTLATLMLFLSPIFYSVNILPENMQMLIFINPLSFVVESARAVLIYGKLPDFVGLAIYSFVSMGVAALGYVFFRKVRPGFADVL